MVLVFSLSILKHLSLEMTGKGARSFLIGHFFFKGEFLLAGNPWLTGDVIQGHDVTFRAG